MSDDRVSAKAAQIIAAARDAFMERGFGYTSMDGVAKGAGVSKMTLYAYFPSKEALFIAVIKSERERVGIALALAAADTEDDLRAILRAYGTVILKLMTSPELTTLFRVILGEARRFPALGRTVYETGPAKMRAELEMVMERARSRGLLNIPNAVTAANLFISLVRADSHLRCLLDPDYVLTEAQRDLQVETAVESFLQFWAHLPEPQN